MGKINFSVNTTSKKKEVIKPKKTKIELMQHITPITTTEEYTYIGDDGEEHKYLGILTKSENSVFGKIVETHTVELTYHSEIKHVDAADEYFTYIDETGEVKTFNGKVEFDLDRNTYVGVIKKRNIKSKPIQIFEEKNNN